MRKIAIAGVVAGLVLFAWGFVSHVVLPLGDVGISSVAGDEALLSALGESLPADGFYFLPGWGEGDPGEEEMAAWQERYRRGPRAVVLFRRAGGDPMSVGQLAVQLLTDVAAGLVAAFLVSVTALGFRPRILFVLLLGLFAWIAVELPLWNWYWFPTDYTLAQALDALVGWGLAGWVLAKLVPAAADA